MDRIERHPPHVDFRRRSTVKRTVGLSLLMVVLAGLAFSVGLAMRKHDDRDLRCSPNSKVLSVVETRDKDGRTIERSIILGQCSDLSEHALDVGLAALTGRLGEPIRPIDTTLP